MQLSELGWNSFFEENMEPFRKEGLKAMRIVHGNRERYKAICELGEFDCEVSGKFRFETTSKSNFPSVGDWVSASIIPNENKAMIHSVLPRKSFFSRKVAGQITDEQIIAANIDTVFIVSGLDMNFNLRRIERFLARAWESNATPVILLNKADLCPEFETRKIEVESIAIGVEVYALSASQKIGMDFLNRYIQKGKTIAFLGSSGVGKSTIINTLLGEEYFRVSEVSKLGSRGRHTTTSGELLIIPDKGMLIDTPGMRELQMWGDEEGLAQVFEDIENFSADCRFRDCSHDKEPGCEVQKAIQNGLLDRKRLESFRKLKREYAYLEERQTMKPSAIEKARWKSVSKMIKSIQ